MGALRQAKFLTAGRVDDGIAVDERRETWLEYQRSNHTSWETYLLSQQGRSVHETAKVMGSSAQAALVRCIFGNPFRMGFASAPLS